MKLTKLYPSLLQKNLSILQFLAHFSNNDDCLQLYFSLKYEGAACAKCSRPILENYYPMGERVFRCRVCHTRISPFADTALRGMRISVSNLFWLIYALADLTRSTSSTRLAKDTGIDVKNVHRLSMIIRKLLLRPFTDRMRGSIEIDEAFLGKGSKVWNWGSISTTKQPIIGMICRETKEARIFLVGNRRASTLNNLIRDNVLSGSTIYTDGWRGYTDLAKDYTHVVVDHSKREYVRGEAHTNTIENLWGRIKRNLRGEHIKISAKYVQHYVNEACFRHNSRGKKRMEVFDEILRLTFSSGFDWSALGMTCDENQRLILSPSKTVRNPKDPDC